MTGEHGMANSLPQITLRCLFEEKCACNSYVSLLWFLLEQGTQHHSKRALKMRVGRVHFATVVVVAMEKKWA